MSFSSAGNGPVATAFVEVTAQTREAERKIDALIKHLQLIDVVADRVSGKVSDSFEKSLREVDRQLREVGAPGLFEDVERQAEIAGESIEDSFVESGRQSEEQLRQIGSAGLFLDVEAEAEQAGESVTNSFEEAQRQSDDQLQQIGGAGTFTPVVVEAEVAGEKIERSFDEASRSSRRSLALIGRAAGVLSLALGAAGVAAVGFGIQQAASLEQTKIGFEALLGSAQEADSFIREMQKFAATTPFEFAGLADNARRLLAMGQAANISREDILPLLTTIGDLVSVLGQPPEAIDRIITALSQMSSKGKVSTEELLQIGEAVPGFPVFQAMADGLGISTAALQDQLQSGSIPATEGIDALIKGMERFPGAAGAMAKQSQTLIGLFSTFKDTISLALVQAFDPLIPQVKSTLAEITPLIQTALTGIAPSLAKIASTLLSGLAPALATIGPPLAGFLADFAQGFSVLAQGLAPALGTVANALSSLGPVMEILGLALQPIAAAFAELLNVLLPPLITVFGQLVQVLGPVLTEIGSLASAFFSALAPALSDLIEPLDTVAKFLGDALLRVLESLEPQMPALGKAIGDLAVAFADFLVALEPLIPVLTELAVIILQVATVALIEMIDTLTTVIKFLTKNKVAFVITATAIAAAFAVWAANAAVAAAATITAASPLLLIVGGLVATAAALRFAFNHFQLFHDIVITVRDVVFALFTDVLAPLAQFLAGLFLTAVRGVVSFFTGPFITAVQTVVDVLLALWHTVLEPLASFLLDVFQVALRVILTILLGPLFVAVFTTIEIFQLLWHTVLEPLGTFLLAVFTPIIKALATVLSVTLRTAVAVVTTVFQFLWNSVLAPFGRFLSASFAVAVSGVKAALSVLKSVIDGVIGAGKTIWHSVLEPFVGFLRATATPVINTLGSAFQVVKSAVDSALGVLKTIYSFLKKVIDRIGGLLSKLKSIPGASQLGGLLDAVGLQRGAIITKDTFAQLHAPEVVIPLNDARRALQLASSSGLLDLLGVTANAQQTGTGIGATFNGSSGSVNIGELNVSFTGPITDEEAQRSAGRFADALETTLQERRLSQAVRTI